MSRPAGRSRATRMLCYFRSRRPFCWGCLCEPWKHGAGAAAARPIAPWAPAIGRRFVIDGLTLSPFSRQPSAFDQRFRQGCMSRLLLLVNMPEVLGDSVPIGVIEVVRHDDLRNV